MGTGARQALLLYMTNYMAYEMRLFNTFVQQLTPLQLSLCVARSLCDC